MKHKKDALDFEIEKRKKVKVSSHLSTKNLERHQEKGSRKLDSMGSSLTIVNDLPPQPPFTRERRETKIGNLTGPGSLTDED
jgi:hypothetical protein